jgi:hypothetical protein
MQQRPTATRTSKLTQNMIGMPNYQFNNSATDINTKHSLQTQTITDRLESQLS